MGIVQEKKNSSIFFRNNIFILLIIFFLSLAIGRFFAPNIFQPMNLFNVFRIASLVGIVAIGQTFVLLTGEIDLSVGSIMSLSLAISTFVLDYGSAVTIIVTLVTGAFLGMINGFAVGKGKLNSLIVTLATLSIFGGLALIVTRGLASYLFGLDFYLYIGKGYLWGLPVPVIIFIVLTIICFIFLNLTKTGRYLYFSGSNPNAAWCSGIRVDKIKILAFSLSGFFAAMAGPLVASQMNRLVPNQGSGFELSSIAIVVLGGTSLAGGKGNIFGTFIAALTYAFLLNILSLSGVGTYLEQVLKGLLLIFIVIIFQVVHNKKNN